MSTSQLFGSYVLEEATTVDPIEVFSDFGDASCGEPEVAQHLMLDFTPDPEIDNEISQKKICDFFNFINNMPDIQNLKVKPKKCEKPASPASTTSVRPDLCKQQTKENVVSMTKTACSMLKVVGEKDMISRAFEGRMPRTDCSLGSYKEEEEENIQQKKRAPRGRIICKCTKPCKTCPVKKPTPSLVKQLSTKLEQWDAMHPNSMDPPGHPPGMQHCILQKQVFEF